MVHGAQESLLGLDGRAHGFSQKEQGLLADHGGGCRRGGAAKKGQAAKARARAATKAAEAAEAAAADSGGGSSSADLAGEVSDEEVEDELPLEDCDPLIFSEDEVASLLDSIAEFRGRGVGEDAEEAFLAFARDVAGDEASDAFAFDDDE